MQWVCVILSYILNFENAYKRNFILFSPLKLHKDNLCSPYDGRWSKTMMGYGIEDTHFVVELTYNYNISSYELGNDFLGITIQSSEVINNAKKLNWPIEQQNDCSILKSPDGYLFYIVDEPIVADIGNVYFCL